MLGMLRRIGFAALAASGPLTADPAAVSPPSAADFARHADHSQLRISPDGLHVGVITRIDGRQGLMVIRLSDKATVGRFSLGQDGSIAEYWWVGPTRIVVSSAIQSGSLDTPRAIGELIAVDADGANRVYLAGYRAPIGKILARGRAGRGISGSNEYEYATLIDPLPADPQHVVIALQKSGADAEISRSKAALLDVNTGARTLLAVAPTDGPSQFLTDPEGVPRFVTTRDREGRHQTWQRADARAEWTLLSDDSEAGSRLVPLRYLPGHKAWFVSDEHGGRDCLVEQDLVSGKLAELSCDPVADLAGTVFSFDRREPIAAIYEAGKPEFRYLFDHPDRLLLEKIQNGFPNEVAWPVSSSQDGRMLILRVASDRNPGRYFLFDRSTGKARYLLSSHSWVDPRQMAERRPIRYAARDGTPIHGYLSLPPGKPEQGLPLVVLPHGGPFGLRDDWSWDSEAQWLAVNGYAVLQVNFRGSGGYGNDHEDAGTQGWDTTMIDDLTDGARWTVREGIADARRLAIFGASYGGYAALMSAVREPDLYRCVVSYVGVADLVSFAKESDIADSRYGRNYIDRFIGSTRERLAAASPLNRIEQLRAPVFIVHGEEDVRVPFAQAKKLRTALAARQHPHEWLFKAGEGHGFDKPENREAFLTRLLAFLDQHTALPRTGTDSGQPAG